MMGYTVTRNPAGLSGKFRDLSEFIRSNNEFSVLEPIIRAFPAEFDIETIKNNRTPLEILFNPSTPLDMIFLKTLTLRYLLDETVVREKLNEKQREAGSEIRRIEEYLKALEEFNENARKVVFSADKLKEAKKGLVKVKEKLDRASLNVPAAFVASRILASVKKNVEQMQQRDFRDGWRDLILLVEDLNNIEREVKAEVEEAFKENTAFKEDVIGVSANDMIGKMFDEVSTIRNDLFDEIGPLSIALEAENGMLPKISLLIERKKDDIREISAELNKCREKCEEADTVVGSVNEAKEGLKTIRKMILEGAK